jgi:hypothetical protein
MCQLDWIPCVQPHQVLDSCADLASHHHALESHHERLAGLLASGAVGEDVAKLRVGELVDAAVGANGEVPPHGGSGLERDALNP